MKDVKEAGKEDVKYGKAASDGEPKWNGCEAEEVPVGARDSR